MKVSCENSCVNYEGSGYCKLSSIRLESTWLECTFFRKELPQAPETNELPSEAKAEGGLT